MRTHLASALGLASVLLIAPAARADEEPTAPSVSPRYTEQDLRVDVMTGTGSDASMMVGAIGLGRIGLFEAGVDGALGTQILGYNYGRFSAAAGLGWQTSSGLRLDVLGEIGATSYSKVGIALFSADPGVSGTAGTGGGKVGPL